MPCKPPLGTESCLQVPHLTPSPNLGKSPWVGGGTAGHTLSLGGAVMARRLSWLGDSHG